MKQHLSWFRALVPTWGFFDEFGAGPRVYLRTGTHANDLGEWQPALPPLPRRPWHLFLNAAGNERLLMISTFDRLIAESQDYLENADAFANTATYRICRRYLQLGLPAGVPHFQFKVTAMLDEDGGMPTLETRDAFVSSVHSTGATL